MLPDTDIAPHSLCRNRLAESLLATLRDLRSAIAAEGEATMSRWRATIQRQMFAPSALNLAHYLAFRRRDLRELQIALMPLGVSSLGRCESRVMPTIDAVIEALAAIAGGHRPSVRATRPPGRGFFCGDRLIRRRADQVFGRAKTRRTVRIMVTMPIESVSDSALPRELLERGMDCARINCAHDTPDDWRSIIRNIRLAEQQTGRACRILMDLSGPRARLGEVLSPSPARRLFPGDRVLLTSEAPADAELFPLQARCMLPEALDQLEIGSRVLIDEGKTISFVEQRFPEGLLLRVVRSGPKGSKLQSEKGLNFPGTSMHVSPLTEKDFADLNFVAQHADMVGYSFVQDVTDVDRLHAELDARSIDRGRPGIVLKVETARAVQNLPELIVRAKGRRPTAVMIARGDLAVELGYERLAEIQEELLWLCEAAHVPVIWATQVLERLVKKGTPSRPEITDAAMSVRAECVMLNKGPCVAQAVSILDDVLSRMQQHQSKKTPQLRALQSWGVTGDANGSSSTKRA